MNRWPACELPRLPGHGLPVRIFDTATRAIAPAAAGPVARMYVCGITPYDATHLGHAATYVAFDLLNRAWRDSGLEVRYVQNVTDVDDPLLERAEATGVDWQVLAKEQTDLFAQDMAALRVLPPDRYIGAVEGIPLVVSAVEKLLADGHAYRVDGTGGEPDGDVYFRVHDDPRFGSVAGLDGTTMRTVFAERGGDPDRPGKQHPLDCLLWRVERPNEPAWEGGGLGRGRPGWHIECTAIAQEHLGASFDVQGGGADLAFPHHEMGAAEGQLLTGCTPYAQVYAHAGMVGLDGHKMSKSRGNLVFVSRLRADGVEPAAIRLAILAHHYREDWEWTADLLTQAQQRLARWRAAAARDAGPGDAAVLDRIRERLADDLDAPGALAVVDAWAQDRLAVDAAPVDGPADADGPAVTNGRSRPRGLVPLAVDGLLGVEL
ncbi:MAG TPA: cysteine--1-D-myo-inosityl 2-amino-2-deoxy-alpha-D-glucopyranoside ligase [Kineosporiaceae bacterium]|nr:cysteine--1-D-myo-inosityl 2-amino-2-deoxy-alpha-D-glucopyranoside ligase [Kineosporiaceae bacterium]